VQYVDISDPLTDATLILVHGSWHNGRSWAAVQEQLTAAGVRSIAPTLPGHREGAKPLEVSHRDYVSSVIDTLNALAGPVVLVGHSFGGSVISRVAALRPERCHGLVYYSAFVPRDGERVADSLPPQFIEFLDQAAAASADRTIELPDEVLRESFANTADERTLARIRTLLVPEPYAPIFEALSLPSLPRPEIPAVYLTCRDDRTMPPGTFHPGQSSRLRDPELLEIEGDHESLFTSPECLTNALLEAIDAIDIARREQASVTTHPASRGASN
jgi:pimeloyl-ACP methyl ester carboxylesterase